jgi:hypothetical protein
MRTPRWFPRACLVGLLFGAAASADAGAPRVFERDVRPVLKAHCFQCHGEEAKPKARLDLRLVRTMRRGGVSGEAVVPGRREESLLWVRVDADEMPPGDKKLSPAEKALIAEWIDQGAANARPEPVSLAPGVEPTEEEKSFWSFQPIRRPEPPVVQGRGRVLTPIDAFLLRRLEAAGLGFSPEADRRTLLRRLTFDLTGLPPTPEEVDAFLGDDRADAYERLVDRLLASPRYGERWARHWMDVAGYSDSDGYTAKDAVRPYAYKYRDYLVRSLNADRPWDELIREQLAGDEMLTAPYTDLAPADLDRLTATGFLRTGPDGTGDPSAEPVTARNDVLAETIKIVSTSLLGLTVGCAQCHNHRYDPIAQEDYYRFRALFEPAYNPAQWRRPADRLISLWTDADRERAAEADARLARVARERAEAFNALVTAVLERELAALPEDLRGKLHAAHGTPPAKRSAEQKQLLEAYPRANVTPGNVYLYDRKAADALTKEFDRKAAEAKKGRPAEDFVASLTEVPGRVPVTRLFARGDVHQPRQEVAPGELSVLAAVTGSPTIPADDPTVPTTGRRLAYAKHLTGGNHPLVPRVLVNRVWMHHFGRGLVETPGDFGAMGARPTHPELLDWLADEFLRGGWTFKRVHRLILTSTAYRQSSRRTPALDVVDPENRLLSRASVRRLEAEAVRDAVLAASGRLNPRMFGAPAPVAPDESGLVVVGLDTRDSAGRPSGKSGSIGVEADRRSLYVQVRRSLPLNLLETFDAPLMAPNCERRSSSTVAPQALLLMNSDFIVEQSDALAARVASEAGAEPAARVRLAWRLAFAAEPSPAQLAGALAYLDGQRSDLASARDDPAAARRPLATLCQALLSANAFLYVD